ncbi:T9SS type A sorting domain-containing protein [bacterium]|nr:T9SS type A sorting domain-containing protein [bacterium]
MTCFNVQELRAQEEIIKYDELQTITSHPTNPVSRRQFGTTMDFNRDWLMCTGYNRNFSDTFFIYAIKMIPQTGEILNRTELHLTNVHSQQYGFYSLMVDSFYFVSVTYEYYNTDVQEIFRKPQIHYFKLSPSDEWEYKGYVDIPAKHHRLMSISSLSAYKDQVAVGLRTYSLDEHDSNELNNAGIVHILKQTSSNEWAITQSLTPPHRYSGDFFGWSLSLNESFLAVSAPEHSYGVNNLPYDADGGKIYLYSKNDTGLWELDKQFVSPHPQRHHKLGHSLALGVDKIYALVHYNGFRQDLVVIDINSGEFEYVSLEHNKVLAQFEEAENVVFRDGYIYLNVRIGNVSKTDNENTPKTERCTGLIYKYENHGLEFKNVISSPSFSTTNNMLVTRDAVFFSDPSADIFSGTARTIQAGVVVHYLKSSCLTSEIDTIIKACEHYVSPSQRFEFDKNTEFSDTFCTSDNCINYINAKLEVYPTKYSSLDIHSACDIYSAPSGSFFYKTGNYLDTIRSSEGCDSIININYSNDIPDAAFEYVGGDMIAEKRFYPEYRWINCYTGDTIPGAIHFIFRPREPGLYSLRVFNGTCYAESGCQLVNVEDINPDILITSDSLSLHPNPSSGRLSLTFGTAQSGTQIKIYDAQGRLVSSLKLKRETLFYNFDLPEESGIYYVVVQTDALPASVHKVVRN